MSNLEELLKQRAELERQIAHAQSESRGKVLADIQALMSANGLTIADLATQERKPRKVKGDRTPVADKYRDKAGNHWSGRGLKPKWLTAAIVGGAKLEDFAV